MFEMQFKGIMFVCLCIVCSLSVPYLVANVSASPTMSLSWHKDNGYSMGNEINGVWTINANVSPDVVYVEFYLGGQLQQNDTSSPFSWQFDTINYSEGMHIIKAVAFNTLGETVIVQVERNFVGFPLFFVFGIVIVVVVVLAISIGTALYITKKRKQDFMEIRSN